MSKLTRFHVIRPHEGDRFYAEGEIREAVASEVKLLVPNVLVPVDERTLAAAQAAEEEQKRQDADKALKAAELLLGAEAASEKAATDRRAAEEASQKAGEDRAASEAALAEATKERQAAELLAIKAAEDRAAAEAAAAQAAEDRIAAEAAAATKTETTPQNKAEDAAPVNNASSTRNGKGD